MFIDASWEQYLQPIKDLVHMELDRERAAFESVKKQIEEENSQLQRRLSHVLNEMEDLKRQLEGQKKKNAAVASKQAPISPSTMPNELAKELTKMSSLRANANSLQKLRTIVGSQVPLGAPDCPDHKKAIPESQKLWNKLNLKVLNEMSYFGMRNIIFWIVIVSRQPIDKVPVEIIRLRTLERDMFKGV